MKKARLFLALSTFFLLTSCGTVGGEGNNNNNNNGGNGGNPFIILPSTNNNQGNTSSLANRTFRYNATGGVTYTLSFSGSNSFTFSMTNPNGNGSATGTYTLSGSSIVLNFTYSSYNGQGSNVSYSTNCTLNGSTILMDMNGTTLTLSE